MKFRYVLHGETITIQEHESAPPPGYPITFIGRLNIPAPAEHFVVRAVDGDKLILEPACDR